MALYSKFSQQNKSSEKLEISKIIGTALIIISILCLIILTFSFPKPIRNFLTGVFGLSGFALFSLLIAIGISLLMNKKIYKNIRYFVFVLSAFLCILLFLHLILTKNALKTQNFSKYIS